MTRIVVDLPAPFGPTKPVTWPGRTVNVMPSSASVGAEPLAQSGDFDRCFHGRFYAGGAVSARCRPLTPG